MSRRNLAWLLGIAAASLLAFSVFNAVPSRADNKDYEMVRLVVDVLHEVRGKYVKELDQDAERKLVEDMINGGLEHLDAHSQYINPKDLKQFEKTNRGSFGGVGIQVGYDRHNRGQLTVLSPLIGTPAFRAGIRADDLIVKIGDKSTENMRLSEAVELIQGKPGDHIKMTLLHEGETEPFECDLVREIIKIESVMGDLRKADKSDQWDFFLDKKTYGVDRVGYIRLSNFSETATKEMQAAVEQLEKDGARGLIIDLRNNPGGLLQAAVDISDMFLTEGRIVSTKGRNEKEEIYDAKEAGTMMLPAEKFPIAILVNKYSASASEIVSAALQDHNRAVIIGERSYGKGSVQNIIYMTENGEKSALKLTTASYWRPSGKNIHRFPDSKESDEWGVKPNPGFEVPMKDDERLEYMIYRQDRDVVRVKKEQGADPDKKEGKSDKKPFVDRVLDRAVEHMKGEIKKVDMLESKKT